MWRLRECLRLHRAVQFALARVIYATCLSGVRFTLVFVGRMWCNSDVKEYGAVKKVNSKVMSVPDAEENVVST